MSGEPRCWTIYVCRAEGCDLAGSEQRACLRGGCPRRRDPGSHSSPVVVIERSQAVRDVVEFVRQQEQGDPSDPADGLFNVADLIEEKFGGERC